MARADDVQPVEVRRSRRRRRTVAAYRHDDGQIVVLVPARFTRAEEREWVAVMVARIEKQESRRKPSDEGLARRAAQLSTRYLEGLARPESVRWVENQEQRWGSCTPSTGTIRLSHRLQGMPAWVIDYVLVHELAHLLEHKHTPAFWKMVERYPRSERAQGYLEGVAQAARLPAGLDDDVEAGAEVEAEVEADVDVDPEDLTG